MSNRLKKDSQQSDDYEEANIMTETVSCVAYLQRNRMIESDNHSQCQRIEDCCQF